MNAYKVAENVGVTISEIRLVGSADEGRQAVSKVSTSSESGMDIAKMLTNGDPPTLMLWGSDE